MDIAAISETWLLGSGSVRERNYTTTPEDKDAFYAHISEVIHSVPAGDNLALLGDFNARVGGNGIAWRPVLCHFGIHSINDELCAAHGLCLPGFFSSGSIRSKVTWMHPRSKH